MPSTRSPTRSELGGAWAARTPSIKVCVRSCVSGQLLESWGRSSSTLTALTLWLGQQTRHANCEN